MNSLHLKYCPWSCGEHGGVEVTNQRPVFRSCDHPGPIRDEYTDFVDTRHQHRMRDCKIAEMPDNDKTSMASSINTILDASNKCELNTSEELLTTSYSDSESGTAYITHIIQYQ